MIKSLFAAAALAGMALSTAATAEPNDPVAATPPAANESAPTAAPKAEQKYCIVETLTGSRIRQKTCKTRGEWMKENSFDPLAPQG
jgi:hypothetical protein